MVEETRKSGDAAPPRTDRAFDSRPQVDDPAVYKVDRGVAYEVPVHEGTRLEAIWRALESVYDPEIPVLSVVDLGIIAQVRFDGAVAKVDMTPTFVGCPALGVIRHEMEAALRAAGESEVEVNVVLDPPWTSDRITEQGRRRLKEFGLAPPSRCFAPTQAPSLDHTPCPFCESTNTDLESIFGPALCRSIHYCRDCLQSFEQFKPL